MPDDPAIDPQAIASLNALSPGDGGAFLRELVGIYLQDTPQRVAELEAALARADTPTIIRAAHTIKGSSSNFGAHRLAKVALAIEMQGKAGTLAEVPAETGRLKAEFEQVAAALRRAAPGT